MNNESTCKECGDIFNDAVQMRRHLRKHRITFQEYSLKWYHDEIEPTCTCGCGKKTLWNVALKGYASFVQGHHALGRKKTDEEKAKIGAKNSVNMKRYMNEHPDIAKTRIKQMISAITPEINAKRIESTKQTYASMTKEEKVKFSDHSKKLWKQGNLMIAAHEKSSTTFKQRSANGEYDFTERNDKLSKVITLKYLNGGFEWAKGTYTSNKTKKKCYYRSSWELQFMKMLDVDDDVLDWESEFTSISYSFEGITHRYVPDFHVMRRTCQQLVEIKPQALRIIPRNEAKRDSAIKYCVERGWNYIEWEPTRDLI
jgi:hypothetical protein